MLSAARKDLFQLGELFEAREANDFRHSSPPDALTSTDETQASTLVQSTKMRKDCFV